MNEMQRHRERIEEFFANIDELSNDGNTLFMLTDNMDFMAMSVLIKMLQGAMLAGDLPDLTETMARFAMRKDTEGDAVTDLVEQTQNERGVN